MNRSNIIRLVKTYPVSLIRLQLRDHCIHDPMLYHMNPISLPQRFFYWSLFVHVIYSSDCSQIGTEGWRRWPKYYKQTLVVTVLELRIWLWIHWSLHCFLSHMTVVDVISIHLIPSISGILFISGSLIPCHLCFVGLSRWCFQGIWHDTLHDLEHVYVSHVSVSQVEFYSMAGVPYTKRHHMSLFSARYSIYGFCQSMELEEQS